jgi:hypothetical protein
MQEAGGMQLRLPLDKTTLGLVTAAIVQMLILLSTAVLLSFKVAKQESLSAQRNIE